MIKNGGFRDAQVMGVAKQAEGGVPFSELCREHGVNSTSFYKSRLKFGGMDTSVVPQMKAMADEYRRLKWMYAEISMRNDLPKDEVVLFFRTVLQLG